jgi:hypothetical protein
MASNKKDKFPRTETGKYKGKKFVTKYNAGEFQAVHATGGGLKAESTLVMKPKKKPSFVINGLKPSTIKKLGL